MGGGSHLDYPFVAKMAEEIGINRHAPHADVKADMKLQRPWKMRLRLNPNIKSR